MVMMSWLCCGDSGECVVVMVMYLPSCSVVGLILRFVIICIILTQEIGILCVVGYVG